MWYEKVALFLLALSVPAPIIFAYFFTGNRDNLGDLQKNLGIAVGVSFISFTLIYGILFYLVQANPNIFVPLVLVLCFINSLISTSGLVASLLRQ